MTDRDDFGFGRPRPGPALPDDVRRLIESDPSYARAPLTIVPTGGVLGSLSVAPGAMVQAMGHAMNEGAEREELAVFSVELHAVRGPWWLSTMRVMVGNSFSPLAVAAMAWRRRRGVGTVLRWAPSSRLALRPGVALRVSLVVHVEAPRLVSVGAVVWTGARVVRGAPWDGA